MNYLLAAAFAMLGTGFLIWNKPLAATVGAFYARRFAATFGKLAHTFGWDNPNRPLNRFIYRGAIIMVGLTLLIFSLAALLGTNFVGPSAQSSGALLQQPQSE